MLIFQQVNQFAQPTIVASIGGRLGKWGRHAAAQTAQRLIMVSREGGEAHETFAACGADSTSDRSHGLQTIFTNWKPGNLNQGSAAKAAVGRKQRRQQALSRKPRPRDKRSASSYIFNLGCRT